MRNKKIYRYSHFNDRLIKIWEYNEKQSVFHLLNIVFFYSYFYKLNNKIQNRSNSIYILHIRINKLIEINKRFFAFQERSCYYVMQSIEVTWVKLNFHHNYYSVSSLLISIFILAKSLGSYHIWTYSS